MHTVYNKIINSAEITMTHYVKANNKCFPNLWYNIIKLVKPVLVHFFEETGSY